MGDQEFVLFKNYSINLIAVAWHVDVHNPGVLLLAVVCSP
jgi:hypothetical protein